MTQDELIDLIKPLRPAQAWRVLGGEQAELDHGLDPVVCTWRDVFDWVEEVIVGLGVVDCDEAVVDWVARLAWQHCEERRVGLEQLAHREYNS